MLRIKTEEGLFQNYHYPENHRYTHENNLFFKEFIEELLTNKIGKKRINFNKLPARQKEPGMLGRKNSMVANLK